MPMGEPVSGPRKWLRSATSIFSNRPGSGPGTSSGNSGMMPLPVTGAPPSAAKPDARAQRAKKFDAPVPLSEFAKRGKVTMHSHNGRRDSLTAGERTRILRMLRDEGGRMADEDSRVYIGAAPSNVDYDFDFDDGPAPAPAMVRPDVPAKPAVVVGIAQAQAARTNQKRGGQTPRSTAQQFAVPRSAPPSPPPYTQAHPPPPQLQAQPHPAPSQLHARPPSSQQPAQPHPSPSQLHARPQPPQLQAQPQQPAPLQLQVQPQPQSQPQPHKSPPPAPRSRHASVVQPSPPRRQVPVSFNEEPTRQVDDALLEALRNAPPAKAAPRTSPSSKSSNGARPPTGDPRAPVEAPRPPLDAVAPLVETDWPGHAPPRPVPIRAAHDEPTRMAKIDQYGFTAPPDIDGREGLDGVDEMTRPSEDFASRLRAPAVAANLGGFEDHQDPDEATRLASLDSMAAMERARAHGQATDERTRAVNIRNDPSISDIDWDLD
jgi:hypothetical protein